MSSFSLSSEPLGLQARRHVTKEAIHPAPPYVFEAHVDLDAELAPSFLSEGRLVLAALRLAEPRLLDLAQGIFVLRGF